MKLYQLAIAMDNLSILVMWHTINQDSKTGHLCLSMELMIHTILEPKNLIHIALLNYGPLQTVKNLLFMSVITH